MTTTSSTSASNGRDTLFAEPQDVRDFVFDERVAAVFDDMIDRSVPGYATTISTIGEIARRSVTAGSYCYDLGCSLGAATLAMRRGIEAANCRIIAVDNSAAMIERGKQLLEDDEQALEKAIDVNMICADIRDIHIENASLVVLNFTLQFLPISDRLHVLQEIAKGMLPGGKLIMSEKIKFPDECINDLNIDLHHRFKQRHGYTELEISQKRSALENRLVPETVDAHKERLQQAGFSRSDIWYQCFNFASLVAIK